MFVRFFLLFDFVYGFEVVGEKSAFKGEFTTAGSIHINGEFEGKISVGGEVIVSSAARVIGEIEGNRPWRVIDFLAVLKR